MLSLMNQSGRGILWLVALMTVAYSFFGILRHWHLQSGYDLAIFDQAVWHYSRFETPANTISGHAHILAEHFHPILVLLAPLYWVLPRAETLLVAQAFLLSASAVPVYRLARERIGAGLGLAMSAAYVLFWGIQKAAAFDFHELALAPLLIALALLGIETGRDAPRRKNLCRHPRLETPPEPES